MADNEENDEEAFESSDLLFAVENDNLEMVQEILSDPTLDLSDVINSALISAAAYGDIIILDLLLKDPRSDPSVDGNRAIQEAIAYDNMDHVRRILEDPRFDPIPNNDLLVKDAVLEQNIPMIQLLLSDGRINPAGHHNENLYLALDNDQGDIAELLLSDPRVDPSIDNNRFLYYAMNNGWFEIVKLILEDVRITLSPEGKEEVRSMVQLNEGFLELFTTGTIEVEPVRLFLQNPKLNPSAPHNRAICNAIMDNNVAVVKLLAEDERVKSNIKPDLAQVIELAAKAPLPIVEIVLQNFNMEEAEYYLLFWRAFGENRTDIIRFLLNHSPFMDQSIDLVPALKNAAATPNTEMLDTLLSNSRVIDNMSNELFPGKNFSPSINRLLASAHLIRAAKSGDLDTIKVLYQEYDARAYYNRNQAFLEAVANRHYQIVQFLPTLFGVYPKIDNDHAMLLAAQNNDLSMITILVGMGLDPHVDEDLPAFIAEQNGYFDLATTIRNL